MDPVWIAMFAPAAVSILSIGLWVWADQVAERRRDRGPARPVIAEGHLSPDVVAVGVAPVPPRSRYYARGRAR